MTISGIRCRNTADSDVRDYDISEIATARKQFNPQAPLALSGRHLERWLQSSALWVSLFAWTSGE